MPQLTSIHVARAFVEVDYTIRLILSPETLDPTNLVTPIQNNLYICRTAKSAYMSHSTASSASPASLSSEQNILEDYEPFLWNIFDKQVNEIHIHYHVHILDN